MGKVGPAITDKEFTITNKEFMKYVECYETGRILSKMFDSAYYIRYQVNENQFSKDYHERFIKIKELAEQMLEELRIMYDSYDKERDKYSHIYNRAYESMNSERKI